MKKFLSIILVVCLLVTTAFSVSANAEGTEYATSVAEADNSAGKVVFTDFDDFSDTSKWKLNQASAVARVSYKDEDSNGVKDYVQLTSGTGKHTYITSVPFTLVPGT